MPACQKPLRQLLQLLAACVLCWPAGQAAANFQEGEFVPTARRGQYHGSRTHWHDLMGRHCPRFGVDRIVALPIPKPTGFLIADEYKVSFAVDGERLFTPWLTIFGKRAPPAPLVDVELERSGDEITAVRAKVEALPEAYVAQHAALLAEARNASHWPKHVLVRYRWADAGTLDVTRTLYVLFIAGLLAFGVVAAAAVSGYQAKLAAFLAELTSEDGGLAGASQPKAD